MYVAGKVAVFVGTFVAAVSYLFHGVIPPSRVYSFINYRRIILLLSCF